MRAMIASGWLWTCVFWTSACMPQGDPGLGPSGFSDNFNRPELGEAWNNTGGPYAIRDGQLTVAGARNKPLWLRRTLPRDVLIEFDVKSDSPDGDIKVEVFGDGVSKAESVSYTATSYVVVFGGWRNSLNVLARMNEHGADRVVGPTYKVVPGRSYHMKILRRGATITAWVDGQVLASMTDPDPLAGPGHDHFAINDWDAALTFDNFRVRPL
ncbi:MAG TPA: family 16 glycoside hydrolase [Polyangiales bacterium]